MVNVPLEALRAHLHADDLAGVDDAAIESYYRAARSYVIRLTQRSEADLVEMSDTLSDSGLPLELEQAVFMLVGHWYNQRETAAGVQMRDVPHGTMALIRPFRKLSK